MDHKMIEHQRGYLLIIAIIAIVVVGFISSILINMYVSTTRSTTNILQADQALYIAKSGLEIARRDLLKMGSIITCSDINSTNAKYTDSCYPPGAANCSGYFSVTGDEKNISTRLSGALDDSSTTIILNSTTDLLTSGIVVIDSEAAWYSGINGNQLLNVKRGAFKTIAVAHPISSSVKQNTCALTATASVSALINPGGKRVVQDLLWKKNNGRGVIPGIDTYTALVAVGSVKMQGTPTVQNLYTSDLSTVGSTIISGSGVSLKGSADTYIGSTVVGQKQHASDKNTSGSDIKANNSVVTQSSLWGYFFPGTTKASYKNSLPSSSITSNCGSYTIPANGIMWFDCNFSSNGQIGSLTNPVTLIVNGDVHINNNDDIYGFLYVIGDLEFNGGGQIHGQAAVEGSVDFQGGGDIIFGENPVYSDYYVTREIFN